MMIQKLTLIFLTSMLSLSAWANTKVVCRETEGPRTTVVLTLLQKNPQLSNGHLNEGQPYDYLLEVYASDVVSPDISAKGTVITEDVLFAFESKDKKINFSLYMDEMDQCSLQIPGQKRINLICY